MPIEYAEMILAVVAILAAVLYLRTRRRRKRKKSAPPVRPASPTIQTAGVASTWAPPAAAKPVHPVAATVVVPPPSSPSWDHPAASPAKPGGLTRVGRARVAARAASPDVGVAPAALRSLPRRTGRPSAAAPDLGIRRRGSPPRARADLGRPPNCRAAPAPRAAARAARAPPRPAPSWGQPQAVPSAPVPQESAPAVPPPAGDRPPNHPCLPSPRRRRGNPPAWQGARRPRQRRPRSWRLGRTAICGGATADRRTIVGAPAPAAPAWEVASQSWNEPAAPRRRHVGQAASPG